MTSSAVEGAGAGGGAADAADAPDMEAGAAAAGVEIAAAGERGPQPRRRRLPTLRLRWLAWPAVEPLLVALLFSVLTALMTWPWTLHMGEAINPFGDVVVQLTSLRWNAHALTTNPGGLFEAPSFYPYAHSAAFSENLIGETLLTLPLLLITGNAALASNFYILLTFVLTGLFTYLLVRDLTGSRLAGLLSGLAFAFCPFRFMQMGHLHMLSTQWFPFTLWALRRGLGVLDYGAWTSRYGAIQQKSILRHPKAAFWLIVAGLGFVAMGLSSIYYTYFLAIAVALYILWWIFAEALPARRVADVRWLPLVVGGVLALAVIGLILGPVFWPYVELNRDLGFTRTSYEVQNWSADWSYYRSVLSSNWLYGHLFAPSWVSAQGERELFPGIVASLLALFGLVWGRGRGRWYYLLLGLASLILTFGLSHNIPLTSKEIALPYTFLYDWVPGFKSLRVPVRFAVMLDFSLYVLAGYGLARMLAFRRPSPRLDQAKADNLGEVVLNTQPLRRIQPKAILADTRGRKWGPILAGVLALLVLLEFVNPLDTANRRDVTTQLASIEPNGWLARPENRGPVLELPMSASQEDVWYSFFGTRDWQPRVNGWSSFVPPGTVHLKQALDAFPDITTVTMLQGLEVRHVVVHLWQYPKTAQAAFKQKLDATPQLKMVDQAGDNYVYEVAPDPWLRPIAEELADKGANVWVGEAKRGSMPAFEVLAYALIKWGVSPSHMGGNIDMGYRPIGTLPFGTPADYVFVPNLPGLNDTPFGYEYMQEVKKNPVMRLLQGPPVVVKVYDMTAANAPKLDLKGLRMGINSTGINFGEAPTSGSPAQIEAINMTFMAFQPSSLLITLEGRSTSITVPAGLARISTRAFSAPTDLTVARASGDARLLKVDLVKASGAGGGPDVTSLPIAAPVPLPIDVTTKRGDSTLDATMKIVAPTGGGDFAATVDVYVEPFGKHPEGHFGYWSVVVLGDGLPHEYTFRLDPLAKKVTSLRDGQPIETFGWQGKPTQGDFRATLYVVRKDSPVAGVPLYLFTLNGGRVTDWQPDGESVLVVRP